MISSVVTPDLHEIIFDGFSFNSSNTSQCKVKVILPDKLFKLDTGAFCIDGIILQLTTNKDSSNNDICSLIPVTDNKWEGYVAEPLRKQNQVFAFIENKWIDVLDLPEMSKVHELWTNFKASKKNAWNECYEEMLDCGFSKSAVISTTRYMSLADAQDFVRVFKELRSMQPDEERLNKALKFYARAHFENVLGIPITSIRGAHTAVHYYANEVGHLITTQPKKGF